MDRQLKIKTSILRRCNKDLSYYRNEIEEETATIAKMTAEGIKTPTDIKQIEMQLGETKMMIPVTMKAIEKALTDLTEFLDKNGAEAEVTGSEHFAEATALMEEVGKHFVAEDGRGAAAGYDDDEEF